MGPIRVKESRNEKVMGSLGTTITMRAWIINTAGQDSCEIVL